MAFSKAVLDLVRAARVGEDCLFALHDALLEDGRPDLAERCNSSKVLDQIDPIWTTMSGRKVPVSELSMQHLKNVYNYLRASKSKRAKKWLQLVEAELENRGTLTK